MKKVLLGTVGLLASATLMAAAMPVRHSVKANPWYAGIGVNRSAVFSDSYNRSNKLKSSLIGFNVFAGYNFSKYWGNELGYSYIGNRKYEEVGGSNTQKVHTNWLINYDVLGYLPVWKYVTVFGKAGVEYWSQRGANVHPDSGTYWQGAKLSTVGANFGGGLQFNYQQFGARLTYTNYETFMETSIQNGYDIPNVLGLDVMYYFG